MWKVWWYVLFFLYQIMNNMNNTWHSNIVDKRKSLPELINTSLYSHTKIIKFSEINFFSKVTIWYSCTKHNMVINDKKGIFAEIICKHLYMYIYVKKNSIILYNMKYLLTTVDTCVLTMTTVSFSPSIWSAFCNVIFRAAASHVVQQNWPHTGSIVRIWKILPGRKWMDCKYEHFMLSF